MMFRSEQRMGPQQQLRLPSIECAYCPFRAVGRADLLEAISRRHEEMHAQERKRPGSEIVIRVRSQVAG